jgi:hypothetical protein
VQARTYASTSNRNSIAAPVAGAVLAASLLLTTTSAQAQQPAYHRDSGWDTATSALAISAWAVELISPRTFSADPEVTAGWKARWHLSVLAPSMAFGALALLNEGYLKKAFKAGRPGCDEAPEEAFLTDPEGHRTIPPLECQTYGMLSTESILAFSALGQGLGVFIVDTTKWSNGQFHAGAFTLEVGVPAVLAILTAVGRSAGNLEDAGQVWGSAGIGVGLGSALEHSTH